MPENKIALYPILGVTGDWLDHPFDLTQLPASILPSVTIEDAKTLFSDRTFELWKGHIAKRERESLEGVRFSIVCRYTDDYGQPDYKTDRDAKRLVQTRRRVSD